jgi:hypothetical protein
MMSYHLELNGMVGKCCQRQRQILRSLFHDDIAIIHPNFLRMGAENARDEMRPLVGRRVEVQYVPQENSLTSNKSSVGFQEIDQ